MVDVSVPHTYAVVNANYTVNVTVRDRLGATATATRQVHVNPKPQPARLRSLTRLPNGHISIQLEGTPNALYRIERCDTFALDWSEVGTSTANSSGQLSIEDSNPSNTSRFYRGIGVQ